MHSLVLIASVLAAAQGAVMQTKQTLFDANVNVECTKSIFALPPLSSIASVLESAGIKVPAVIPTYDNLCTELFNGKCTTNLQELIASTPNNILFKCTTADVCPTTSTAQPLFANTFNVVCEDQSADACNCAAGSAAKKCTATVTGIIPASPLPTPHFCTCCNPAAKAVVPAPVVPALESDKKNEIETS